MKTLRLLCHTTAFALILTLGASLAHAQNFVSWVSGVGSDTNPCDRELPCRTFGGALAKTLAGGVINVLEPGTFPLVTITNSITIDGGGGQVAASEASFGQNAITVNAGANDVVILRNLRFDGFSGTGSGGANGIVCTSVGQLHVENVYISGYQNGIKVDMGATAEITMRNVTIENNSQAGIFLQTTGPAIAVTLDNVLIANAEVGVLAGQNAKATVMRSSIVGMSLTGLSASAAGAEIDVDSTLIAYNDTGISAASFGTGNSAASPGLARVSNSSLTFNGTGVLGNVGSFAPGTNRFASNASDGTFGLAAVPLK